MNVKVKHDRQSHKFHAVIDDEVAYLHYRTKGSGKLEYYETYVPMDHRHQRIASQLADTALSYAKNNQYQVIPTCSFVRSYIKNHEEFKDITTQR
ncbi:MAG: N-acetyltransferase [Flavobacteriales bacterium]|nr:N-acetyltransferase [Flavobacteriales bacterium]